LFPVTSQPGAVFRNIAEHMKIRPLAVVFAICIFASVSFAQKTEITLSLNEQFFDSLLDAVFQNSSPPEFPLTGSGERASSGCGDSITLLRENRSTRTAVRFRDGKIFAPVAFSGRYAPPFLGCIDFGGYAETNVDIEFDRSAQKLVGRVRVLNVVLNGSSGVGGQLIARMVQSSIDKKMNPIEVVRLDKLSFPFTLQNSTQLRMKATSIRPEIASGVLNVIIAYEFVKD
jgi:hypothetical protein